MAANPVDARLTASHVTLVAENARRFARTRWTTTDVDLILGVALERMLTNAAAGDDAPLTVGMMTSPRESEFYAGAPSHYAPAPGVVVVHQLMFNNTSPYTVRLVVAALRRRLFSVAIRVWRDHESDLLTAWLAHDGGGAASDATLMTEWRRVYDRHCSDGHTCQSHVELVISPRPTE